MYKDKPVVLIAAEPALNFNRPVLFELGQMGLRMLLYDERNVVGFAEFLRAVPLSLLHGLLTTLLKLVLIHEPFALGLCCLNKILVTAVLSISCQSNSEILYNIKDNTDDLSEENRRVIIDI